MKESALEKDRVCTHCKEKMRVTAEAMRVHARQCEIAQRLKRIVKEGE